MARLGYLTGTVKHYDWGGTGFIPSLLDIKDINDQPFAEYWLGVHPQADCKIIFPSGDVLLLKDYLAEHPEELGNDTLNRFGNMPYLLKALDVKNMLSIQVHPSKTAALADFAEENRRGIPLDSPSRNYKDDNHKPELMLAMDEFWLLHGFRPPESMEKILNEVPELRPLAPVFEIDGYAGLYRTIMMMLQADVNAQLDPLLQRIVPLYRAANLPKSSPHFWAARAALSFSQRGNADRGIFSVYLFNLVNLHRGQAIFQDAGVPHAYLEGRNVEIMASSDNVLRGGLTTKHIDVKELLKHTRCEATYPDILDGDAEDGERIFRTPAPDFQLSQITLGNAGSCSLSTTSAEIFLLTSGTLRIASGDAAIELQKGNPSAIVFAGERVTLTSSSGAVVYRAAVPPPRHS